MPPAEPGVLRDLTEPSASGDGEAAVEGTVAVAASGKLALTAIVIAAVLAIDLLTKWWAVETLTLYQPVPVLGDFFQFTYTHNPGAAFGIDIGEHSRVFFLALSLVALAVLAAIHRTTPAWDRLRIFALSLIAGGALGNIVDRFRYEAGVVDFLDFGIGTSRFPVFNMADTAVTIGAALLLISFYLEGRRERPDEAAD